ncbi:MAG: polysaccharide biosynthesis/export family protein [Planctomycetes bacterium]|nr:polysaccharide biosynthesis/export family protein [Planctomycetota bacterium]
MSNATKRLTRWFAVAASGVAACIVGASVSSGDAPAVRVVGDDIRLCQALGPAAPHPIWGVDSAAGGACAEVGWDARGMIPWQEFAQGEYVGHARAPHVPEYRLREGDVVAVYYRRTREELSRPYELEVGDRIRVESLTAGSNAAAPGEGDLAPADDDISRELVVQPDGTITLPLLGQVRATRRTIASLRDELEEQYKKYFRVPAITVTPIEVSTKLEDLLNTVDSRAGTLGGLQISVTVTPAGEIQLPGIHSVYVQGLSLSEARQEIDARYDAAIPGVQITLVLVERAQRFIYVLGEVGQSGRYELEGPTTAMQAIALAGGWNPGSNLRQVVVFRRGDDWRLMATMLDLRGALYARRPVPADDIWLNDSDIILVPKTPIEQADELIEQVFTRGVYGLIPREVIWDFNTGTAL